MRSRIVIVLFPVILFSCGTVSVNPMEGTEVWSISSSGATRTVLVHPPRSSFENPPGFLGSGCLDGGDMTMSTTDDGFTLVNNYWSYIVHTDLLSNIIWYYKIPYGTTLWAFNKQHNGCFCQIGH